jgi:hypothetical protein
MHPSDIPHNIYLFFYPRVVQNSAKKAQRSVECRLKIGVVHGNSNAQLVAQRLARAVANGAKTSRHIAGVGWFTYPSARNPSPGPIVNQL